MNKVETINGIRLDIQKEEDAISTYDLQASKTHDKRVKKVLKSIANEERVHVGELTKLLDILVGECKYIHEGKVEVVKDLGLKEFGGKYKMGYKGSTHSRYGVGKHQRGKRYQEVRGM